MVGYQGVGLFLKLPVNKKLLTGRVRANNFILIIFFVKLKQTKQVLVFRTQNIINI